MEKNISVIIPTYNRRDFLKKAIESVLVQTCPPDELIIVDDGSTDNTPELVAGYGDSIVYIRQQNRGPAAARNTGIRKARSSLEN